MDEEKNRKILEKAMEINEEIQQIAFENKMIDIMKPEPMGYSSSHPKSLFKEGTFDYSMAPSGDKISQIKKTYEQAEKIKTTPNNQYKRNLDLSSHVSTSSTGETTLKNVAVVDYETVGGQGKKGFAATQLAMRYTLDDGTERAFNRFMALPKETIDMLTKIATKAGDDAKGVRTLSEAEKSQLLWMRDFKAGEDVNGHMTISAFHEDQKDNTIITREDMAMIKKNIAMFDERNLGTDGKSSTYNNLVSSKVAAQDMLKVLGITGVTDISKIMFMSHNGVNFDNERLYKQIAQVVGTNKDFQLKYLDTLTAARIAYTRGKDNASGKFVYGHSASEMEKFAGVTSKMQNIFLTENREKLVTEVADRMTQGNMRGIIHTAIGDVIGEMGFSKPLVSKLMGMVQDDADTLGFITKGQIYKAKTSYTRKHEEEGMFYGEDALVTEGSQNHLQHNNRIIKKGNGYQVGDIAKIGTNKYTLKLTNMDFGTESYIVANSPEELVDKASGFLEVGKDKGMSTEKYKASNNSMAVNLDKLFSSVRLFNDFMELGDKATGNTAEQKATIKFLSENGLQKNPVLQGIAKGLSASELKGNQAKLLLQQLGRQTGLLKSFDYSASDILSYIGLQSGRNDFNSMKTRFRTFASSLEGIIGKEDVQTLIEATNQLTYSRGESGLYGLAEIFSSVVTSSSNYKPFTPQVSGKGLKIDEITKQIQKTVSTYRSHFTENSVQSLLSNAKSGGLLAQALTGMATKARLDKLGIKTKLTQNAEKGKIRAGTLGDDLSLLEDAAKKAGANISFVPSKDERSLEVRISAEADLGTGNYASMTIPLADAEGRILHNHVEKADTLRFITDTKHNDLSFDVVTSGQNMIRQMTRAISQKEGKDGKPTFMENVNASDYDAARGYLRWIEGLNFDSAASLQASATLRDLSDEALVHLNKKNLRAKTDRVDFTDGVNWLIESQKLDEIKTPEGYLSEFYSADEVRNSIMNYILLESMGLGESWLKENPNDRILNALQDKKIIGSGANASNFALTNFVRANLPIGTLKPQAEARFGMKNQINFSNVAEDVSGVDLTSETKRAQEQATKTLKKINQELKSERRQVLQSGHKNAIKDYLNTSESAQFNLLGITDELISATIEQEAQAIANNPNAYSDIYKAEIAKYQAMAPSVHESGVLITKEALKEVDSYRNEKKVIDDDLYKDEQFQKFLEQAGYTLDDLRKLEDGEKLDLSNKNIEEGLLWGRKNSRRNMIKNKGDALNYITRSEGRLYLNFNRFLGGNEGQKLLMELTGSRTTVNSIVSKQFMTRLAQMAGFTDPGYFDNEGIIKADVATQIEKISKTTVTDAIAQYNYIFDEYLKQDGANIDTLKTALNINPALARYFTPIVGKDGKIDHIESFATRTRDENRTLMGKDVDGNLTTLFDNKDQAKAFISTDIDDLAKTLGVASPNAKGYGGSIYAMYRSGMGTADVYQWRRANGFDTYGNTREYGSLKVDPKSRHTIQRRIAMARTEANANALDMYAQAWDAFGSQENDPVFQRLQAEAEHMQNALRYTSGRRSVQDTDKVYELTMNKIHTELAKDMGIRDGKQGHGYSPAAYADTPYGALAKELLGQGYNYIKIRTNNAMHFPVGKYSNESFSTNDFYIPLMDAMINNGEIDPRSFESSFANVIKQMSRGTDADIQRALSGMMSSIGNDIMYKEGSMNVALNKKVAMNAMSGVARGMNYHNEKMMLEGDASPLTYKDIIMSPERMREMLTISDDLWNSKSKANQNLLKTAKQNLAFTYKNLQEQLGVKDIKDFGKITAENQSEIIDEILKMTDVSSVGKDGKLGRIAGTLLRWPLVTALGQPIVNLVNDSSLRDTNNIIMNSGLAKLVSGDFDDDTLYAAMSLMSKRFGSYKNFKKAMEGHDILANTQAIQTQILARQYQAKFANDSNAGTGISESEKEKAIDKVATYLYSGGKQDAFETIMSKRNFNQIGKFSNISTSVRESFDAIGLGAHGKKFGEVAVGEVLNAFNEFFEQDVISAKNIGGRLDEMYQSGDVTGTQEILNGVIDAYNALKSSNYNFADVEKHWISTIEQIAETGLLGKTNELEKMTFKGKQLDRALSGLEAKLLSQGLTQDKVEMKINKALGLTDTSYRQMVTEGGRNYSEYSIPLSAIPKLFGIAEGKLKEVLPNAKNLMTYRYEHLPFGTQYDETNTGTLMTNAVKRTILQSDYTHKNNLENYQTTYYKVAKEDNHIYIGENGKKSDFSVTQAGNLLFGKSEGEYYKDIPPENQRTIEEIWARASSVMADGEDENKNIENFMKALSADQRLALTDQSFLNDAQKYLKTKLFSSTRGTAVHGIFEDLEKNKIFDNKEIYNEDGSLNTDKFLEQMMKTENYQKLEKDYGNVNKALGRMGLKSFFGETDIQDAKDIATLYAQNRGAIKKAGHLALLEEFETLTHIGDDKVGLTLGGKFDGITLKGITDYKIKKGGGRAIGLLESWQLNAGWRNKVAQMDADLKQAGIHNLSEMDTDGEWFKRIEELSAKGQGSQLLEALSKKGLMSDYQEMLHSYKSGEDPELTIQQFVKGKKGWNMLTHYFKVMDESTFNALTNVLQQYRDTGKTKDYLIKQQVEAIAQFADLNMKRLGESHGVNLEGKAVNPYDVDDGLYGIETISDPKQREEFFKYYNSLSNKNKGQFVTQEKVMNMFGLQYETDKDKLKPIRDAFRNYLNNEMDITKLKANERTLLSSYLMDGMEDIFSIERQVQREANAVYNNELFFSENNVDRYLWNKSYETINKPSSTSSTTQSKNDFKEEIFLANELGENVLKPTKTGYELSYGDNQKIQITTDKDKINLKELVNKLDDKGVQEALKGVTSILHTHKDSFMPSIEDLHTFGKMAEKLKTLGKAQIYDVTNALLSTIDLNQFRDEDTGEWISAKWEKYTERLNSLRDNPDKAIEEGLLKSEDAAGINASMSTIVKTEEIPLKYHNIASALANLGKTDIADIYKLTAEEMLSSPELVQFNDYIEKYDKGLEKSYKDLQSNETKIKEADKQLSETKTKIEEANKKGYDTKTAQKHLDNLNSILSRFGEGTLKGTKGEIRTINNILKKAGMGDQSYDEEKYNKDDAKKWLQEKISNNNVSSAISSTISNLENSVALNNQYTTQVQELTKLKNSQEISEQEFDKRLDEAQKATTYGNKRHQTVQAMKQAINYSEGKDMSAEAKEAYEELYGSRKEEEGSLRKQIEEAAEKAGITVDKDFIKGIKQEAKAEIRADNTESNKLLQETTSQFNALQQMMAQNAPTQFLNSMTAGLEKNLETLGKNEKGLDAVQEGIKKVVSEMSDTHKVQMLQNIDQQFQGSMAQLRNIQLAKANAEAQLTDERRVLFGDNKGTYRTTKESIINPYMSKMMNEKLNQLSIEEAKVQAEVTQQMQSVKGTPMEQQMLEQQKFNQQIVETNKQVKETQRYATQGANGLQRFGQSFKGMLNTAFQYGVVYRGAQAIIQQIFTIIGAVKQFDTMATQIRMINNASKETATDMIKGYKDIADELGTLTTSVTQASITFLRQGRSIADTNQLIKDSAMLAKVGMMEEAQSAELLTATLNGFQLEAKDAADVVDLVSYTDTIAATSTQELMTAFQYVASSANNAGIDIEHLNSMITTTSEATRLTASTIGQAFKTIVSRIQQVKAGSLTDAESGEDISNVDKVLKQHGIEVYSSTGGLATGQDILAGVGKQWKTLSKAQQREITEALGGTRQGNIVMSLMENWDRNEEILADTEANASGSAAIKQDIYNESIDASIARLQNALQDVFSEEGWAKDTYKWVIDLMTAFADLGGPIIILTGLFLLLKNNAVGLNTVYNIQAGLTNKLIGGFKSLNGSMQALLGGTNNYRVKQAQQGLVNGTVSTISGGGLSAIVDPVTGVIGEPMESAKVAQTVAFQNTENLRKNMIAGGMWQQGEVYGSASEGTWNRMQQAQLGLQNVAVSNTGVSASKIQDLNNFIGKQVVARNITDVQGTQIMEGAKAIAQRGVNTEAFDRIFGEAYMSDGKLKTGVDFEGITKDLQTDTDNFLKDHPEMKPEIEQSTDVFGILNNTIKQVIESLKVFNAKLNGEDYTSQQEGEGNQTSQKNTQDAGKKVEALDNEIADLDKQIEQQQIVNEAYSSQEMDDFLGENAFLKADEDMNSHQQLEKLKSTREAKVAERERLMDYVSDEDLKQIKGREEKRRVEKQQSLQSDLESKKANKIKAHEELDLANKNLVTAEQEYNDTQKAKQQADKKVEDLKNRRNSIGDNAELDKLEQNSQQWKELNEAIDESPSTDKKQRRIDSKRIDSEYQSIVDRNNAQGIDIQDQLVQRTELDRQITEAETERAQVTQNANEAEQRYNAAKTEATVASEKAAIADQEESVASERAAQTDNLEAGTGGSNIPPTNGHNGNLRGGFFGAMGGTWNDKLNKLPDGSMGKNLAQGGLSAVSMAGMMMTTSATSEMLTRNGMDSSLASGLGMGAGMLSSSLMMMGPWGMVAGGAITAITSIMNIQAKKEEEKNDKIRETVKQAAEDFKNTSEKLRKISDEEFVSAFNDLSKGVDSQGRNETLTDTEYDQFKDYINTLTEDHAELIVGYDEEGNALVDMNTILAESTRLTKEHTKAQREDMYANAVANKLAIEDRQKELKEDKKQIDKELKEAQIDLKDGSIQGAEYIRNKKTLETIQRQLNQLDTEFEKENKDMYKNYATTVDGYENLSDESQKLIGMFIDTQETKSTNNYNIITGMVTELVDKLQSGSELSYALANYNKLSDVATNVNNQDRTKLQIDLINSVIETFGTDVDGRNTAFELLKSYGVLSKEATFDNFTVDNNGKFNGVIQDLEYQVRQRMKKDNIDDDSINSFLNTLTIDQIKMVYENYDSLLLKSATQMDNGASATENMISALDGFIEKTQTFSKTLNTTLIKQGAEGLEILKTALQNYNTELKQMPDGSWAKVMDANTIESITTFADKFGLTIEQLDTILTNNEGVWELTNNSVDQLYKEGYKELIKTQNINDLGTLRMLAQQGKSYGIEGIEEAGYINYIKEQFKNDRVQYNAITGKVELISGTKIMGREEEMYNKAVEYVNKNGLGVTLNEVGKAYQTEEEIIFGLQNQFQNGTVTGTLARYLANDSQDSYGSLIGKGTDAIFKFNQGAEEGKKSFDVLIASIQEASQSLGGISGIANTISNSDFGKDEVDMTAVYNAINNGDVEGGLNKLNEGMDGALTSVLSQKGGVYAILEGLYLNAQQQTAENQINNDPIKLNEAYREGMNSYEKLSMEKQAYDAHKAVKDLEAQMRVDDLHLDKVQAGFDKLAKSIENLGNTMNNLDSNDFVGKFDLINQQLGYSDEYMTELNTSTGDLGQKFAEATTYAEMNAIYEQMAKNEEAYSAQLQKQIDLRKEQNSLIVNAFNSSIENQQKMFEREMSILQMQRNNIRPEKRNYYNVDALMSSALMMPNATKDNVEKARSESKKILKIQQESEKKLYEYKKQVLDQLYKETKESNEKQLPILKAEADKADAMLKGYVQGLYNDTIGKIDEVGKTLNTAMSIFRTNWDGKAINIPVELTLPNGQKISTMASGTGETLAEEADRLQKAGKLGYNGTDNEFYWADYIDETKKSEYIDAYIRTNATSIVHGEEMRQKIYSDLGYSDSEYDADMKKISENYTTYTLNTNDANPIPTKNGYTLYTIADSKLQNLYYKTDGQIVGQIVAANFKVSDATSQISDPQISVVYWGSSKVEGITEPKIENIVQSNYDATPDKKISNGIISVAEKAPEFVQFKNGSSAIFDKLTMLEGSQVEFIAQANEANQGKANGKFLGGSYFNGGGKIPETTIDISDEIAENLEENHESIITNIEETNKDIFDKTKKHNEDIITDVEDTNKKVYNNTKRTNQDTYKDVNDTNYAIKDNTKKSLDETLVLFDKFFDEMKTQLNTDEGFMPVSSQSITSNFGMRNGRQHKGVDLGYSEGSALYASKPLTITNTGFDDGGYGNYVYATDGKYEFRFGHLSSIDVKEGQVLEMGGLIGKTGNTGRSTGPHLHYEIRENGVAIDPTGKYVFYDKGVGESNKRDLSSLGIMSEKQGEYKVDKETGEWIYEPQETIVDTDKYDVINSKDSQAIRNRAYDEGTPVTNDTQIQDIIGHYLYKGDGLNKGQYIYVVGLNDGNGNMGSSHFTTRQLIDGQMTERYQRFNKYQLIKQGFKFTEEPDWFKNYSLQDKTNTEEIQTQLKDIIDTQETISTNTEKKNDNTNTKTTADVKEKEEEKDIFTIRMEQFLEEIKSVPKMLSEEYRDSVKEDTYYTKREDYLIQQALNRGDIDYVVEASRGFDDRRLERTANQVVESSTKIIKEYEDKLQRMSEFFSENYSQMTTDQINEYYDAYDQVLSAIENANQKIQDQIDNTANDIVQNVDYIMSRIVANQKEITKAMEDVDRIAGKLRETQKYQLATLSMNKFLLATEDYENSNIHMTALTEQVSNIKDIIYDSMIKAGFHDADNKLYDMLENYAYADYTVNEENKQNLSSLIQNFYDASDVSSDLQLAIDSGLQSLPLLLEKQQTTQSELNQADSERYAMMWSLIDNTSAYYEEAKNERYSIYEAILVNNDFVKQLVQMQGKLIKDTDTLNKSSNMVENYNRLLDDIQANQSKYNATLIDIKDIQNNLFSVEGYNTKEWFDAQGNIIAANYNQDKRNIEKEMSKALEKGDNDRIVELTPILSAMTTIEQLYKDSAQALLDTGTSIEEAINYQKEIMVYSKELLKTFNDELVAEFKKNTETNKMSIDFLSKIEDTLSVFDRGDKLISINSQLRVNSNERQNLLGQRSAVQWSTEELTNQITDITDAIDIGSLFTVTGEQQIANYNEAQKILDDLKETGEISDGQYNTIKNNIDQIGENLKEEVSLNNDIISNYQTENSLLDEKIKLEQESYDWQITKMQSLLELKEKQFEVENKIFDLRYDLDKELRSAKQSMQWLTKSERLKIFNEEDYTQLYQAIDKMEEQSQAYYEDYYNQIMGLTEETLYQQEYITAEYQRRMELVEAEYNLTQKRVDLEKQQLKLKNILAEKNTRMYINGEWVQVANTDDVISESEALADAEAELKKAEEERLQKIESQRMSEYIDGLKQIQASLENSTKSTNETEQQLINELAKLTGALVGGELNTDSLSLLIDSLNTNVYNFVQKSDKLINEELLQSIKELETIFDGLETYIANYNSVLDTNIRNTDIQLANLNTQVADLSNLFNVMDTFGEKIKSILDSFENYSNEIIDTTEIPYDIANSDIYDAMNEVNWAKKIYEEATTESEKAWAHQYANTYREKLVELGARDIAQFLTVANYEQGYAFQQQYKSVGESGAMNAMYGIISKEQIATAQGKQIAEIIENIIQQKELWNNTNDNNIKEKATLEATTLRTELKDYGNVVGNQVGSMLSRVLTNLNASETESFNQMLKDNNYNLTQTFNQWNAIQKDNNKQMYLNVREQSASIETFKTSTDKYEVAIIEGQKIVATEQATGKTFETTVEKFANKADELPDDLYQAISNGISQLTQQSSNNSNNSSNNSSNYNVSSSGSNQGYTSDTTGVKQNNATATIPGVGTVGVYINSSGKTETTGLPVGTVVHTSGGDYTITGGTGGNYTSTSSNNTSTKTISVPRPGTYGTKKANGGVTDSLLELANIDEIGKELYIPSGRLKMMEYGDQVIPHNLSENLLKWGALNPAILQSSNPEVTSINTNKKELNVKIDNVNLENVTNGENFMPELNRYLSRTTTLDRK